MREDYLDLPKENNNSSTNEAIEVLEESDLVSEEPIKPKTTEDEVLTMSKEEDEIYKTMKIENLKRFQYQQSQKTNDDSEKKLVLKYQEDDEPYKPSGFISFAIVFLILALVIIALLIVVLLIFM